MNSDEIKAKREKWEDDNYTKGIDCPAHPAHQGYDHAAVLYLQGHRNAGTWECPLTGESDEHEHSDYEIEELEVPDSPDRTDGYSYQVYVCGGDNGCGVTIDREIADPALDALEAQIDSQIDEERGK